MDKRMKDFWDNYVLNFAPYAGISVDDLNERGREAFGLSRAEEESVPRRLLDEATEEAILGGLGIDPSAGTTIYMAPDDCIVIEGI